MQLKALKYYFGEVEDSQLWMTIYLVLQDGRTIKTQKIFSKNELQELTFPAEIMIPEELQNFETEIDLAFDEIKFLE